VANVGLYENHLKKLLDDPSSIAQTPGFQFEFDQGQQAVSRGMRGMRGSGNALAALQKFGQGLASTRRGEEIDRLGRLTGQEQQFHLGEGQLDLGNRRLALDDRLGTGQLDLGRGRLALDDRLGSGRLALDDKLGMGQLGVARDRLGFDRESDVRRDATARRGQDFEFDLGGRRLTNERDLGFGRIAADLQRGEWDYDINGRRLDLDSSRNENEFNLARERAGLDRYNARTNRMGTRANAEYQRGRNRREEIPLRDPWSVY
jgi:hypothetical protein